MLVGTPFPVNLSVFVALEPALWIGRVLVRSQEGQLEARCDIESCRASTILDSLVLVRRVLLERQIEFEAPQDVPALASWRPTRTSPAFKRANPGIPRCSGSMATRRRAVAWLDLGSWAGRVPKPDDHAGTIVRL